MRLVLLFCTALLLAACTPAVATNTSSTSAATTAVATQLTSAEAVTPTSLPAPTASPEATVPPTPSEIPATPTATPFPPLTDTSGAEGAVRRAYNALASGDRNAYIDSLDPAVRSEPDALAVLSVATKAMTGLEIDTTHISFRDLQFHATHGTPDWAFVHVTGFVRQLQFAVEFPLNGDEVAHNIQGQWYLSNVGTFESGPEEEAYVGAVATATAAAQAQATAVTIAAQNQRTLIDIGKVVVDKDWYIAAEELRQILMSQPNNQQAIDMLASIAPHVQGGIMLGNHVYQYSSPFPAYFGFASVPGESLPAALTGESRVSFFPASGKYAIISYPSVKLDLATGATSSNSDLPSGKFNRDGSKIFIDNTNTQNGIEYVDLSTGRRFPVCSNLKLQSSQFYWSGNRYLLSMNPYFEGAPGIRSAQDAFVVVFDAQNNTCAKVSVPGLSSSDLAVVQDSNPGVVEIVTKDKVLSVNIGSGEIKKLADIVVLGYKPTGYDAEVYADSYQGPIATSSDEEYVAYRGMIVSLRTGRAVYILDNENNHIAIVNASAWLDTAPSFLSFHANQVVTISPTQGDPMTSFLITVHASSIFKSVDYEVTSSPGHVIASETLSLDASGTGSAHFVPGIDAQAGTYTVTIKVGSPSFDLGSASFQISG